MNASEKRKRRRQKDFQKDRQMKTERWKRETEESKKYHKKNKNM